MELKIDKLILKPKKRVKIDVLEKYQELIDVVCGKGDDEDTNQFFFQKQAIEELLSYFLEYSNLNELLSENLFHNSELEEYYKNLYGSDFKNKLDDLDKRIATIDLPTGTGKSYVMFLIAIILLNELPKIDRIQIITPSKTIKKQLNIKFEELFDKIKSIQGLTLPNLTSLHEDALNYNCLAIDNIHKFYETDNAILSKEESFGSDKGKNVLVINDEAHHIYNFNQGSAPRSVEYQDIKKWKEFLFNPNYNIKNIINFTATPFESKNTYLHNVIYRYGLMRALNNKVVKDIKYLPKGDEKISEIQAEKQQLLLAVEQLNEIKNRFKKEGIKKKPIGIIITADIMEAKKVEEDFKKILLLDKKEANIDEKVICYTSDPEHLKNEELFDNIDIYDGNKANKVEWIISVSMLSEGWDCKNVFLIVPHQERAFNSKLLISQVVGRGLRRVPNLDNKYQEVIVLNHKKWGDESINLLINDVVDTTTKIAIKPTQEFNFDIDYLEEEFNDFEKDFNEIQKDREIKNINKISIKETLDKAINNFKEQIKDLDIEIGTKTLRDKEEGFLQLNLETSFYTKKYLIDWYNQGIKFDNDFTDKFNNAEEFNNYIFESSIIKKSKIKDKISVYNFNAIEKEFSNIDWGISEKIKENNKKYKLKTKNTDEFGASYIGIKTFLDDYKKVFYSQEIFKIEEWEYLDDLINYKYKLSIKDKELTDKKEIILKDLAKEEVLERFENIDKNKYKNPLNLLLPESEPEKIFIERLFRNNVNIEAWIKSKSRGFYYIDCSKAEYKIEFNPDFIIKMKNEVYLLVEIKSNNDINIKNKFKLEGLYNYLEELNKTLKDNKKYFGYIITPDDYDNVFTEIINKNNYSYEPGFHKKLKKVKI
ncbi:MAG: DEAD/DEAH box helicase family protein [Deltaproteobacteria bacterium]|nr:DEAD/DEAH box helicase family protein [Deltaproteobacteria bacterium]